MDDNKWSTVLIIILSIVLIISGIGILKNFTGPDIMIGCPLSRNFAVGMKEGPSELDPVNSKGWASENVIYQVCEGLYTHDLSDPNLGIIPRLAEDFGSWDPSGKHYTIPLRENILYHEEAPFNAEAVKWNFERLNWFLNGTGTLNTTIAQIHYLWEFPNGTVIFDPINPVTINNDYSITINLRAPYAILESLLCHVSAFMLSPISTPKYEYVHLVYGNILGTGPFVYDHYVADKEVKFHMWEKYWYGSAFFEEVTFKIINDATTRNNAMLGHTIDYLIGSLSSIMSVYNADQSITHQTGTSLSYYFLDMNSEAINKTWRQAISYGINYTYMIEELQDGTVFRSNGPLAPNFPSYFPNIKAADYNLTKAREIVVSMGFGDMGWTDAQWRASTFAIWNYTYRIGDDFREDFLILLQDNLELIGIDVIDAGWACADFIWPPIPCGEFNWEISHFYWRGIEPDFFSPYNMLYKLFSYKSTENGYHYHNHDVEMWLNQVLKEPNVAARQALYSNILHQIVEVDMPHAFGYHPYQHYVHSADIRGVPYNALGSLYIYPMYRP